MRLFLLPAFVVGLFVYESLRTGAYLVSGRMARFSKGMDRFLLFVPALAAAVFAVLFLFVLKGRFYERLCHALLVLAFWLYATRFYWFLISFYGRWKKTNEDFFRSDPCICSAGLIGAAYSAIILTPLDRYVKLVHSGLGAASILPGAGMLILFYAATYLRFRQKGKGE